MRKSPPNKYKVPLKEWNKWLPESQELFNEIYRQMADISIFAVGGENNKQFKPYWDTVRWNAAWTAAAELNNMIKEDASERLLKAIDHHAQTIQSAC
jgi:hypothetical protein